jgi:hypothetical protein
VALLAKPRVSGQYRPTLADKEGSFVRECPINPSAVDAPMRGVYYRLRSRDKSRLFSFATSRAPVRGFYVADSQLRRTANMGILEAAKPAVVEKKV